MTKTFGFVKHYSNESGWYNLTGNDKGAIMPIVRIDPPNPDAVNVLQVDSDAADNRQAMREIDDWAAERGFVRTNEFWLRRVRTRDGKNVFRGICYRIEVDERETIRETNERMRRELEEQPATPHVVE